MSAAEPRSAATILLVRDGQHGELEVFLVRRHPKSGFLGGAHVFPGGKVDEADRHPEAIAALGLAPGALHPDEAGGATRVAAIRETHEEAGVVVPPSQLAYMSRWITPEAEPRRYDTRFYVALCPTDQVAAHDELETTAGAWFSPQGAIEAMRRRDLFLAPPTLRNLEILAEATTAEDALQRTRLADKPTVQPDLVLRDGAVVILMPGDPDYSGPSGPPWVPGPSRFVLVDGVWEYPKTA